MLTPALTEELLYPKPLVAAVDDAIGYLEAIFVYSGVEAEADCPDLFRVTHDQFKGEITRREDFNHFEAWLAREVGRDPKILMVLDDMTPRIRLTL